MNIRAKTFKNWLKANFTRSELNSIADYGANTGWYGLTYYSQTTKLYEKFKDEIWEHIIEESEADGYSNPFAYLAEFESAKSIEDEITMKNWLVWYMAESIAYRLIEDR